MTGMSIKIIHILFTFWVIGSSAPLRDTTSLTEGMEERLPDSELALRGD